MALGLVIQNFIRINIDYMIKILIEATMRAAKDFENFNIFMIHTVLERKVELSYMYKMYGPGYMYIVTQQLNMNK